jgi:hypothetical protein
VLSRLLATAIISAIGWHSKVFMLVSWMLAGGTAYFLVGRFIVIFDPAVRWLWATMVGTALLAVFSPIQAENWLWGFQMAWFLVNAGTVAAIFSVASDEGIAHRLFWATLFGLVSTLSSAQGLMVWPALIVSFAAKAKNKD